MAVVAGGSTNHWILGDTCGGIGKRSFAAPHRQESSQQEDRDNHALALSPGHPPLPMLAHDEESLAMRVLGESIRT